MSDMIPVVHDGSALQTAAGRILRLKDLLAPDALAGGRRVIATAHRTRRGHIRLTLTNGDRVEVPEPPLDPPARPDPDLVVTGARQVLTMDGSGTGLLEGAAVICGGGRILAVMPEARARAEAPRARRVDAEGGVLAPGLIDPHTHPVYAGERSAEFAMKAEGRSYLEIHRAGGGILATVRATRAAGFDTLVDRCRENLARLLSFGVTTCEAKSGYGLTLTGELRLLRAIRAASERHPVDAEPTLLGAHALPPEHAGDRSAYVTLVAHEMVPRAAAAGLARFCDAYCEEGAFTPAEVSRVFEAARAAGLGVRLHAEQFTDQGGAALAARMGALSADHLEAIGQEAIDAMARSGTVAVLLPGAALTCRAPWPPATRLLAAGVPVALGTDLNPGTSMTANLPLMMSLACTQMGLSCDLAWRAVTVEAARALGREDIGRIAPGCRADLAVFGVGDHRQVPYHYGENHLRLAIKGGRVAFRAPPRP